MFWWVTTDSLCPSSARPRLCPTRRRTPATERRTNSVVLGPVHKLMGTSWSPRRSRTSPTWDGRVSSISLVSLFVFGVDRILPRGDKSPRKIHKPLESLPLLTKTELFSTPIVPQLFPSSYSLPEFLSQQKLEWFLLVQSLRSFYHCS